MTVAALLLILVARAIPSFIGVAVLKCWTQARNPAVLPAVVGTIAVTCAAASGFTGGLIGS